jgi:hypothetical protein
MSAWDLESETTNSWTYDGPPRYTLAVVSLGWVGGLHDELSGSVAAIISTLTTKNSKGKHTVHTFPSDPKYAWYNWNGDGLVSITFVLSIDSGAGATVGRLDFWE